MNTGAQRENGMGLRALWDMFTKPDPIEEDINEMEVEQELKSPSAQMKYLMKQYGTEPEKTKTRKSKIRGAQLSSSSQTKKVEQKEIQEKENNQEERSL